MTRMQDMALRSFAFAVAAIASSLNGEAAYAGGRVENACKAYFSDTSDAQAYRQNMAMCTCFDRPLEAAGVSPQDIRTLVTNFDFPMIGKLLDRDPTQKKAAEKCMSEKFNATR